MSSIDIDDARAGPFQPDILYRRFDASPVLGTPQGADGELSGGPFVLVTRQYYHGDDSNQNAPMPGYHSLTPRSFYRVNRRFEIFGSVQNVIDARYAAYGLFSDPTGVGAPGIPKDAGPNDPRVDNRFQSPAAPRAVFGGVKITFQ